MKPCFPILVILLLVSTSFIGVGNQVKELKTDKIEIVDAVNSNCCTWGYWKFDEGSGNIAHDYMGQGFDGTIYGATWTVGSSGYALDFNGENSYVDLDTHSDSLGFSKGGECELSAWVKTESTEAGVVYCISNTESVVLYCDIALDSEGTIEFRVGTLDCELTCISAAGYNDGDWHLIEGKYYGDPVNPTMELWVDEVLEDSVTEWMCPFSSDDFETAKIGRKSADDVYPDYFDGIIDEVKLSRSMPCPSPPKPILTGDNEVKLGEEYTLTIQTPWYHDYSLEYNIAWGDGDVEWTEFYDPDIIVKVKHIYDKKANVMIKVYSEDEIYQNSETATMSITVPKSYNPIWWLYDIFNRFPLLQLLLGWFI